MKGHPNAKQSRIPAYSELSRWGEWKETLEVSHSQPTGLRLLGLAEQCQREAEASTPPSRASLDFQDGLVGGREAVSALSLCPFELVWLPAGRPPGYQGTSRREKMTLLGRESLCLCMMYRPAEANLTCR